MKVFVRRGMIDWEYEEWYRCGNGFCDTVRYNHIHSWQRYMHGNQRTQTLHSGCYWMILE